MTDTIAVGSHSLLRNLTRNGEQWRIRQVGETKRRLGSVWTLHVWHGVVAAGLDAESRGRFWFTTSTVSQQIAALAKVAGEQLIEPDGRRVRLTPAGRRLADHAVTILAVDAARLDLDPEAEPLICNDPRPLRAPRQRPRAPGGDRRHRPRCLRFVPRSPLRRAGLVRIFPRIAGIEAAGSGGGVPGPNYAPQTVRFHYSVRRRSVRTRHQSR